MTIHLKTEDEIDGAMVSARWDSSEKKIWFDFNRASSFSPESWEAFSDEAIDYLHAFKGLTEVVEAVTSDEDVAPFRNGSGPDFESEGGGSNPSGAAKNFPSVHDMVKEFMDGANQAPLLDFPHFPSTRVRELRRNLILEEWKEFLEATSLESVADALGDMVYVIYGTAYAYGFNLDEVVREIHRSNMTKIADGIFDESGKLLKGPNYDPPRLEDVLWPLGENLI